MAKEQLFDLKADPGCLRLLPKRDRPGCLSFDSARESSQLVFLALLCTSRDHGLLPGSRDGQAAVVVKRDHLAVQEDVH